MLESDALTAERIDALTQARAAGKFGSGAANTTKPAAGWVGSRVLSTFDDWEPAVATDPGAPYEYLLTTRYGVDAPGCAHFGARSGFCVMEKTFCGHQRGGAVIKARGHLG